VNRISRLEMWRRGKQCQTFSLSVGTGGFFRGTVALSSAASRVVEGNAAIYRGYNFFVVVRTNIS